jgi:hypothetical protein
MFKEIMRLFKGKKKEPKAQRKSILEEMFEEGMKARLNGPVMTYYQHVVFHENACVAQVAARKEMAWKSGWSYMDNLLKSKAMQAEMVE